VDKPVVEIAGQGAPSALDSHPPPHNNYLNSFQGVTTGIQNTAFSVKKDGIQSERTHNKFWYLRMPYLRHWKPARISENVSSVAHIQPILCISPKKTLSPASIRLESVNTYRIVVVVVAAVVVVVAVCL